MPESSFCKASVSEPSGIILQTARKSRSQCWAGRVLSTMMARGDRILQLPMKLEASANFRCLLTALIFKVKWGRNKWLFIPIAVTITRKLYQPEAVSAHKELAGERGKYKGRVLQRNGINATKDYSLVIILIRKGGDINLKCYSTYWADSFPLPNDYYH